MINHGENYEEKDRERKDLNVFVANLRIFHRVLEILVKRRLALLKEIDGSVQIVIKPVYFPIEFVTHCEKADSSFRNSIERDPRALSLIHI